MTTFRKLILTAAVAPLALTLSACGSADGADGVTEGEPIAPIAAPEGQQWIDVVNVSDYDGYIVGNPDAPIKMIEYGSLTCGACAAFAATGVEPLKSEYVSSGRVSFELRNQIHNGIDLVLARLVRCGPKEAFHPRSDAVWANLNNIMAAAQQNGAALDAAMRLPENQRFVATAQAAGLFEFFGARGLGRDQAEQCLADAASVSAIAENSNKQSAELGVTGTPTFFINGAKVDANSWTQIEPMLQRAGAR